MGWYNPGEDRIPLLPYELLGFSMGCFFRSEIAHLLLRFRPVGGGGVGGGEGGGIEALGFWW